MFKKVLVLILTITIISSNFLITYAAQDFSVIGKADFINDVADGFAISVKGDYAYVAARTDGVRIFDISDKTAPVDITPDMDVLQGTTAIDAPEAVYINNEYLYVCFTTVSPDGKAEKGVRKYDLRKNPESPELLCTYKANNAVSVYVNGGYTFVADKKYGVKIYKDNSEKPYKTLLEAGAENVSDFAFANEFLYVSYTDGGVLIYSLHDIRNPILFTKKDISVATNVTRIVVNENTICLADQGAKKLHIIDLNSINGDMVYIANAKIYSTSLGLAKFEVRDMEFKDGFLYVSSTTDLFIVDIDEPMNVKLCKKVSATVVNFVFCENFLVGSARKNGINIVSLGEVPAGNEIIPYEVILEELIEKNTKMDTVTFFDVTNSHNRSAIEKLADKCIISGDGSGMFYPDENATYAEYMTTLLRAINVNPTDYFECYETVSVEDWYAEYVQSAYDTSILTNIDIEFKKEITKLDAALLTYNTLSYICEKELEATSVIRISDILDINEKNLNVLSWLIKEKLFTITKDNLFNPDRIVTRNDMALYISRMLSWCEDNNIDLTKFRQAPILLRTSDAVKPGSIFNVYGEGLFADEIEAAIAPFTKDIVSEEPNKECIKLDVEYLDESAQYASFVFPSGLKSGVYAMWLKNQYGWSKPIFINKARALWLSSEQVSVGNEIYVSGRNFDLSEVGGKTDTHVMLSGTNGSFEADVIMVNPYAIKFTVSENVPNGDYIVSVSNDGTLYSECDDNVPLTVKAKMKDPYNIGVAWVDEFNWDNVVNVKDYGAVENDEQYDTEAIQKAIDSVAEKGGVVYLPEGTYLTEGLMLPGYVVIVGAGKDKTELLYRGNYDERPQSEINADVLIQSDYARRGAEGRQGIIDITLDVDKSVDTKYQPKNYFWLGNKWNPINAEERTASYIIIKNSKIGTRSFDWEKMEGVEGLFDKLWRTACVVQADKYLLVENCEFLGDVAQLTSTYMNRYISFRNNVVNTFYGNVYCHCENTVYENNSITRCPWYIGKDVAQSRQGIYSRNNCYVAYNTINNTGCYRGDGEVIATESYNSGTRMYGNVIAAGAKVLKLQPKTNPTGFVLDHKTWGNEAWDFSKKGYGTWNIVITEGKGLGQTRNIVSADANTRTIKIDRPWDVVPDSTSKFTVYLPENNITYYKNEVSNCSWGFLLYGAGLDNVISSNKGYNTQGIDISAILKESYSENSGENMDNRVWFHYFVKCNNNEFIGPSWKNKVVGITLNVKYESGDLNGRYAYGIEIIDNYIKGDGGTGDEVIEHLNKLGSEGATSIAYGAYNGIGLRFLNGKKRVADSKQGQAIIIQGNKMENMDRGITFGGDRYSTDINADYVNNYASSNTEGVILEGNVFENVNTPYVRYNDSKTVFLDEQEDK